MGFFSNLKNALTGGWASVNLTTGEARLGEPLEVAVDVAVRSNEVQIDGVYLLIECRELVEIDNYRVPGRADPDEHDHDREHDHVDVRASEELFERRLVLAEAQSLDANSRHVYEARVEIPDHLPPSYAGRHARIEWRVLAGLDTKGNDPDSAWQKLHVR